MRSAQTIRLAFLFLIACGSVEESSPRHLATPQHPQLAPNGRSNMHNDAYMTDSYEIDGPQGRSPVTHARSYSEAINTCTTLVFDAQGRVITTNASLLSFTILLIDPVTLESLATYPLPPRDPDDPLFPYNDTSGATYFALDAEQRLIFSDATNAIQIIGYDEEAEAFVPIARFDLSAAVMALPPPARDHVQMAMPDWDGRYLWFTTRYGMIGTLDTGDGRVQTHALAGEEIENSFAVGEDGIYIVTDHAMYRFSAASDGAPQVDWRSEYDRGNRVKPGNFNQGSGTTPHVFGEMVAIADNAEPRMHVVFMRRADGQPVCEVAVFPEGQGTTENGMAGLVRQGAEGLEYSLIVDNNYGIQRGDILVPGRSWRQHVGGLTRVDMVPDGGGYRCYEVWHSDEKSSGILPKLSLSSGLLYVYTHHLRQDGEYDFALTALDFAGGRTRFGIPTGPGLTFANFGSPLAIGPDHAAYFGTLGGIVKIADDISR